MTYKINNITRLGVDRISILGEFKENNQVIEVNGRVELFISQGMKDEFLAEINRRKVEWENGTTAFNQLKTQYEGKEINL